MTLLGLPLSTLLAIFGGAGALTALLYVLKLRRRPVAVVFSPIWQRVLRDKEASQLFSRLKRLLSLLLQLLLLALIVFSLGDPRLASSAQNGRNIVVLVDASASMQATDVQPSRLEQAKRKVLDLIEGLGGSDRMLIAQMDAILTPLSTMTGDPAALRNAASSLGATDTRADLSRALSFASDSLRDLDNTEIVLVSDGALGDIKKTVEQAGLSGTKLSFIPVGSGGENVAITQLSARRYPLDKSRYEVMLELLNTDDERREVELTLTGDGDVVNMTRLALGPRERLRRFYSDLGGASRRLEATIAPVDGRGDALPADDRAFALMPERTRSRVLVVTPGNTYLEAALLLDEYLDVTVIGPQEYPDDGQYDVTIFDGVAPRVAKGTRSMLYLAPPEEGAPVALGKKIEDFGFDTWDKKSPLLRFIAMENIQVASGHVLEPQPGDHVVGASYKGPILVSGRRDGRPFVALGFDPRRSDFVLRVGWPLFVLNAIDSFSSDGVGYLSSYRTGEVWRVPVPEDAETAQLKLPDGSRIPVGVRDGRAVYFGERTGFYELGVAGSTAAATAFAANLSDPEESRIEPVKEIELSSGPVGGVVGFTRGIRREIWMYLLLAAAALSLIEWALYHRRITV